MFKVLFSSACSPTEISPGDSKSWDILVIEVPHSACPSATNTALGRAPWIRPSIVWKPLLVRKGITEGSGSVCVQMMFKWWKLPSSLFGRYTPSSAPLRHFMDFLYGTFITPYACLTKFRYMTYILICAHWSVVYSKEGIIGSSNIQSASTFPQLRLARVHACVHACVFIHECTCVSVVWIRILSKPTITFGVLIFTVSPLPLFCVFSCKLFVEENGSSMLCNFSYCDFLQFARFNLIHLNRI